MRHGGARREEGRERAVIGKQGGAMGRLRGREETRLHAQTAHWDSKASMSKG